MNGLEEYYRAQQVCYVQDLQLYANRKEAEVLTLRRELAAMEAENAELRKRLEGKE